MTLVSCLIAFVLGALATAACMIAIYRRLTAAEIAHATSAAEGRAASELAAAKTEASQSQEQLTDARARLADASERLAGRDAQLLQAREQLVAERTERAAFTARLEDLQRMQAQAEQAFRAISEQIFRSNSESFLQLARGEIERLQQGSQSALLEREDAIGAMLGPIRDGLAAYDAKLQEIERERVESYTHLAAHVEQVSRASEALRAETASLGSALRSPHVRGTWGEVQLRRCCELAGMLDHCDFLTQHSVEGEDGKLRPDLVVQLPGGRTVVIDAKVPLTAYLEASACEEEGRRMPLLREYAASLRRHMEALSRKAYWEQFEHAPEFVILFLPAESFFSAALAGEPALIEEAADNRIIVATPTTLIALLKAVAYGWRQEQVAQNAQRISELGNELYDRLRTLTERFNEVGERLGQSVEAYNRAVSSFERRVLVSARRFQELGAATGDGVGELVTIDMPPRLIGPPEPTPARSPAAGLAVR